jgi:hypothetical protein
MTAEEFLTSMKPLSDAMIDEKFRDRCVAMGERGNVTADDMIDLLDDAVCYALVNDKMVMIMDLVWRKVLGGSDEQAERRRAARAA